MRGLYLEDGELRLRTDIASPEPGPDEVLIGVDRAGICGTDLEMVRGYKGGFCGVLGHEFVGRVEWASDPAQVGRRVTASINVGCNQCAVCRRDGPEHCARRTVIGILGRDGVFADQVVIPAFNLHRIPDNVPDEHAVFAEPLAAALRIREQVAVRPDQRAAVVGPGRLGMLAARVLSLGGTRVTVIGRRSESLALAGTWRLHSDLTGAAGKSSFDLVVEATGDPAGFAEAIRLVRPRGTLVLKSTYAAATRPDAGRPSRPFDLTEIVVAEIRVVGSRCGPFAPALRLLEDRVIDLDALIDGEYPLSEGLAAFNHAARPGIRKILLRPS